MQEVLLLKLGELVLKGLNRHRFEEKLINELRRHLRPCGSFEIVSRQSTLYVEPGEGFDMDRACDICRKIFGIVAICRAAVCEKDAAAITKCAADYLGAELRRAKTFKVEAKRSDKRFPLTSIQLMQLVGGDLDDMFPDTRVDVNEPELTIRVEIREVAAYVHGNPIPGAGGLPSGINGRATLMISGGIDSPVAAWLMARRGLELHAVHFFSYPYTSEEAKQKVIDLLKIISGWSGTIALDIAPFTQIQEEIRDNCPEELFTVIMRRFMVRVAQRLASDNDSHALITGESLGQVASQTLYALVVTDEVAGMPVFRPLIGLDKTDIIRYAQAIGTFDTSILPYEDCCTVFTPRHPNTKPKLALIEAAERKLNVTELVDACVRGVERQYIR